MAQRSSLKRLDPRIKDAVDTAIAEGRATIDELVALIAAHGGDVSRSAVGRYKKTMEDSLRRYREAQEVAGGWVRQFQLDPDGDVGRLLAEMLKTLAFQSLADTQAESVDGKELMFLSTAIKNLADIDRIKAAMEAKVRASIKAKVGAAMDKIEGEAAGAKGRIAPETLQRIRQEVYGIVDAVPS